MPKPTETTKPTDLTFHKTPGTPRTLPSGLSTVQEEQEVMVIRPGTPTLPKLENTITKLPTETQEATTAPTLHPENVQATKQPNKSTCCSLQ